MILNVFYLLITKLDHPLIYVAKFSKQLLWI